MGHPAELFDESRTCFFLDAPLKTRIVFLYLSVATLLYSVFYLISYWESTSLNVFLFSMSFVLSFALVALWRHVVVIDLKENTLEVRKGFLIPSQVQRLNLNQFTHIGFRCRCIGLLTSPRSRFIIYLYNNSDQRIDICCSRTRSLCCEQVRSIAKKINLREIE